MALQKSKWEFKTIKRAPKGKVELVGLSPLQEEKIDRYVSALEVAAASNVANPIFSNYHVKASVGIDPNFLRGGNIEYGLCQALHGEESSVAALRSQFGRTDVGEIVLGLIAGQPGNIATPCGNCRDILLDAFSGKLEIVSGAADGGVAVVVNMSEYLFSESELHEINVGELSKDIRGRVRKAIISGTRLVNDAYSPKNVHPERRYHALIATQRHDFVGARDIMCEYHPIYAIRDAIRQARRANDPYVRAVVIVGEDCGKIPHIMYKDRQHLLEFNLQAELLIREEQDPPIYVVTYGRNGELVNAWKTSVKECLPLPFSPSNFGPEFLEYLAKYYRGIGQ